MYIDWNSILSVILVGLFILIAIGFIFIAIGFYYFLGFKLMELSHKIDKTQTLNSANSILSGIGGGLIVLLLPEIYSTNAPWYINLFSIIMFIGVAFAIFFLFVFMMVIIKMLKKKKIKLVWVELKSHFTKR